MAVSYSAFLYPAFMSGSWKAIALLLFRRDRKQGRLFVLGLLEGRSTKSYTVDLYQGRITYG
jgi:hypothetical protein